LFKVLTIRLTPVYLTFSYSLVITVRKVPDGAVQNIQMCLR